MHKGVGDTALPKNAHFDGNQEAAAASLQLIGGIHPRKPKQPATQEQAPNMTEWSQWSPTQKAGTMLCLLSRRKPKPSVSMKSDLEGRNNAPSSISTPAPRIRLNEVRPRRPEQCDRPGRETDGGIGLNEVRPRRPEQSAGEPGDGVDCVIVSMKSGLEGRNNRVSPSRT